MIHESLDAGLSNFVWQSLTGAHRHLALGERRARRYHPDISPFAALQDGSVESFKDLAALVPVGDLVLLRDEMVGLGRGWVLESQTPALQMILPASASAALVDTCRILTMEDVPAMLDLTQLVLPGFFRKRSLEMGSFFGFFDGDRLVAMTGERVFPTPYREITAVCTHPAFQGRGLATQLVSHVSARMRMAGFIPFLHTGVNNTSAIAVYHRLGFLDNGVVPLNGIRRV